jgi:hypothetical protein
MHCGGISSPHCHPACDIAVYYYSREPYGRLPTVRAYDPEAPLLASTVPDPDAADSDVDGNEDEQPFAKVGETVDVVVAFAGLGFFSLLRKLIMYNCPESTLGNFLAWPRTISSQSTFFWKPMPNSSNPTTSSWHPGLHFQFQSDIVLSYRRVGKKIWRDYRGVRHPQPN